MLSVAIRALLLCCPAQNVGELETVLSTLEKRVETVRDFRASFTYTYFDTDGRTKEKRPKVPFQGDLSFRAPDRAAWTVHVNAGAADHQGYAAWVDPQKGFRGALDREEFRLHIPWKLHVPEDFGGLRPREHHGAVYYRAGLETHSPAPLPLLAQPPEFHPILFLFELSPRAILGRLPSLAVSGRREEEGKRFLVLTTRPADPADAARIDESLRRRDQTWMRGEIWIDEAEGAIDRVVMEYENASAFPRHRYEHVFKYGRRVGGIATLITAPWLQLDLQNLRSNVGVKDEEVRIEFPADAIVRDWVAQPQSVYDSRLEKDPTDAASWLSLGTLRFRQQKYAAAVEAFKKVVELRPKAPEGHVALSYFLKERNLADSVGDYLQDRVQAGADFPVLRLALGHHFSTRQGGKSPAHFEAVLKQVGEDPEILETMVYTSAPPTRQERSRHYIRTFKAEIERNQPTFAYVRWQDANPTVAERQELAALYEAALAKDGGSPWMQKRLIDLYSGSKPKEARRQADAVVALVEVEEEPQTFGAADRALEFYVGEKDWDSALRLQKAFAAKPGASARKTAGLYETEIAGARATMDELKQLVDERIKPEWNPREKLSYSPTYVRLIKVLQREKRSTEFLTKIVESIGDDLNRPLYVDIVESAVQNFYVPHADGQSLLLRLRVKTTGTLAGAADLVALSQQYLAAKQWGPAAEQATQALAHKEATVVQRAYAEEVLARCHEASKKFDQVIAACDRALELKEGTRPIFRSGLYELRARALLDSGQPRAAAESYGRAFGELPAEPRLEKRWRALQELRRDLRHPAGFREEIEAAAAALPEDVGRKLLLLTILERESQSARAARILADLSAGDGFLLQTLGILWARAGDPQKALAARTAFLAVRDSQRDALRAVQAETLLSLDWAVVNALEAKGELPPLKEFGVTLAKEPDPERQFSTIVRILVAVSDDAFIEQIHALLMGAATREDQRLYFRYAAAQAWHEMGKTDKAIALYKDAAEGKGFSPTYARSAKESIERWEAEERDRSEFRRWVGARLENPPPGRGEPEELRAIISELTTSRNLSLLDRQWRTAIKAEKPDPFYLKLAAVRSRGTEERTLALKRLVAAAGTAPVWRLELASDYLNTGEVAKAYDEVRDVLKQGGLPETSREGFLSRCVPFARRLPPDKRAEFGRDLDTGGAFRWAWELREDFLTDRATRLDFSRRWKAAAVPGEDRIRALEAVARTLIDLDRGKEALGELTEALQEKDLTIHHRRMLEELRLEPLVRFGPVGEAVPALIRHLERVPESSHEATRWAYVVTRNRDGGEWLKSWDEAKPNLPAAVLFGSLVEDRLDRRAAGLSRLQEGARRFPGNAWLLRQLGDSASVLQKVDIAAEAYGKALSLGTLSLWETNAVRRQWVLSTGRAGQLKEAAEIIRSIPDRAQRLQYGGIAEELKLYDLAVELYREDLEGRQETVALHLSLARVLKAAGKLDGAEAEYRLLLKMDAGERRWALSGLFSTLVDKKDAAGIAGALFEEAKKIKGDRRERVAVEHLLWMIPHPWCRSVAEEWLTLARRSADVEDVRILSSTLNRRWGLHSIVFDEDLRTALEKFPRSPLLHLEAAESWSESHRYLEAALEFETAANLDPQGAQTGLSSRFLRGRALGARMVGHDYLKALPKAAALLGETASEDTESGFARQALATIEERVPDEFWPELSRHRALLPVPRDLGADLKRLLQDLEADEIETRDAAEKGLRAAKLAALPSLVALLDTPDLELGVRVRRTLRAILKG